ncbi:MAG: ABC transporter ATP-binding protein [Candidatus Nanohalobium sp.]
MTVIKADKVSKSFGELDALRNISFEVEEGEIVGILGPNGAGKSTLMNILTGQMERDSGEVEVLGQDPEDDPAGLREKLGILPEREDPPSFLTGREYLDFVADIRGEHPNRGKWIAKLNMEKDMEKLTQDLSKGERQKLMIAQAFFHEPELVFIDEPLINLDPFIQEEAKDVFREHVEDGGTLVMSTHVVSLAEELCDRVLFIEDDIVVEEVEDVENLREKFLDEG